MTEYPEHDTRTRGRPSGWAVGGTVFAGVMLLLVGIFHAIAGLVAIFDDQFFVVARNYTFEVDTTGWGWIHLLGGIVVAAGGLALFSGAKWARILGITVAVLSAVANFFFIPYYPVWSVLIIALCIAVIWALTVYNEDAALARG
jgi:hypothetical protein